VLVSDAVATAVASLGTEAAFGLAGSGNFMLVNALRDAGVDYHGACHEAGAVAMADGYARASGRVGVATLHQGPGFTNALTPLLEAVKSATPLVVLAAESPARAAHGNQVVDQERLADSLGAVVLRVDEPGTAMESVAEAFRRTEEERRPVVVGLPIDIQVRDLPIDATEAPRPHSTPRRPPADAAVTALADALAQSRRPLILAGRGAVAADAGPPLLALAELIGAPLTTTIVAKGLFSGAPLHAGVLGGFASPLTWELADQADMFLVFGASLDAWTTCGGRIPRPTALLARVDDDAAALAEPNPGSLVIDADARLTAEALLECLAGRTRVCGWGAARLRDRLAAYRRTDEIPDAASAALDPRSLAIELNGRLPERRVVALDSGHFLAFASIYLDSPDGRSFLFAQGFQAVGLGLGVAIGAAVACPDRVVAAVLGDGGAKMSLLELDTAVRHALPLAVIVFDDGGYGAEVHDFEPLGVPVDIARFPSRDFAAVARALDATGVTVRSIADLDAMAGWLERPEGPIVLDCKVDPRVDAVSLLTEAGAAEWSMPAPLPPDNRPSGGTC
jgi:thiamine pyrophosphate-dependent acetolactate synthase large subunit-like protein